MTDNDWNNLVYVVIGVFLFCLFSYLYSQHRKKARIRLLKKLRFRVLTKINRMTRSTLCKLAPEIMSSCKTSFGTVKIGDDPSVWWLATSKSEKHDLYIFKIYKLHERSTNDYVSKEWIVVVLKNNNSEQIEPQRLLNKVPTPDDYELSENSICLIYRDLFISIDKLKEIIKGVHWHKSEKQC